MRTAYGAPGPPPSFYYPGTEAHRHGRDAPAARSAPSKGHPYCTDGPRQRSESAHLALRTSPTVFGEIGFARDAARRRISVTAARLRPAKTREAKTVRGFPDSVTGTNRPKPRENALASAAAHDRIV